MTRTCVRAITGWSYRTKAVMSFDGTGWATTGGAQRRSIAAIVRIRARIAQLGLPFEVNPVAPPDDESIRSRMRGAAVRVWCRRHDLLSGGSASAARGLDLSGRISSMIKPATLVDTYPHIEF